MSDEERPPEPAERPEQPAHPGRPEGERRPRRFQAVLAAVALTIIGVGVGTLLGSVPAIALRFAGAERLVAVAVSIIVTELVYAAVAVIYLVWTRLRVTVRAPSLVAAGWIMLAVICLYVLQTAASLAARAFGAGGASSGLTEIGMKNPAFLLFIAVASVVVVGPAEELLFRAAMQGRLRRSFGPVAAIGISSALFAGAHVFGYSGAVAGIAIAIAVTFVISLVLGYTYERTGNIVVNAIIHGFYNAVTVVIAYLALTAS